MNPLVIIGGLIGALFGHLPGLVIGAGIGYLLARTVRVSVIGAATKVQSQFLDSTFAVMGAVCKADGQVTHDEIRVAEMLFDRLHLSPTARESAKQAFNRGKTPGFDLDGEVRRFALAARGQRVLLQMFLQVQLSAVAADGAAHPAEREMLTRIARGLGLSEAEVQALEAMLRGGASAGGTRAPSPSAIDDAYRVLGVPSSASDADVKKAYRRLMSQNHPDKLAAKGLPESMREMAEQKTREITAAYELIERMRKA
ncbi:co-chaperone DjlA [Solimonas marina]|uniref:Co-chaperone DjlA n=1 Tax=Solimonas marina TaxID=2714601 RepID=A0A970B848_9GAMM|nr:co-chaperone DjlA [Solimonas marina]NKF24608.1 co-chaperone DjlA [Solimonas marina]